MGAAYMVTEFAGSIAKSQFDLRGARHNVPLRAAFAFCRELNRMPAITGRNAMKGKIGLEEHFAIDDTLNDSKGFFPEVTWIEVRDRIMDIHGRRIRLMD